MLDNAWRSERLTSSGVMFKEVFSESTVRDGEAIRTSAGAPTASNMLDGESSLKQPSIGLTSLVGVQSAIAAGAGAGAEWVRLITCGRVLPSVWGS